MPSEYSPIILIFEISFDFWSKVGTRLVQESLRDFAWDCPIPLLWNVLWTVLWNVPWTFRGTKRKTPALTFYSQNWGSLYNRTRFLPKHTHGCGRNRAGGLPDNALFIFSRRRACYCPVGLLSAVSDSGLSVITSITCCTELSSCFTALSM